MLLERQQREDFLNYSTDCLPNLESTNREEKEDAQWLNNMREAKANKKSDWYPVLDEIADQIGWSGIFDSDTPEQIAIERFRHIVKKYSLDK